MKIQTYCKYPIKYKHKTIVNIQFTVNTNFCELVVKCKHKTIVNIQVMIASPVIKGYFPVSLETKHHIDAIYDNFVQYF